MRAWVLAVALASCSRDEPAIARADRPHVPPPVVPVPVSPPPKETPTAPVPSPSPPPPPPAFDAAAARAALARVPYRACGAGAKARVKVVLRFETSGKATTLRAVSADPAVDLPDVVETCLVKAFDRARVPPFVGAPVTIAMVAPL